MNNRKIRYLRAIIASKEAEFEGECYSATWLPAWVCALELGPFLAAVRPEEQVHLSEFGGLIVRVTLRSAPFRNRRISTL